MKKFFVAAIIFNVVISAFSAETAADFKTLFAVANKAYTAGKWQEAETLLLKAMPAAKTEWQKFAVNYRLAYCSNHTRQNEKTIAYAADALKYAKIDARDRNRFSNITADALIRLKRYDEAMKVLDKQLAEPAREDNLYYTTVITKGVVLYEQKKYKESLDVLLQAQKFAKVEAVVKNKLNWYTGAAAMKVGDKATARKYFETVAKEAKGWFASSAKKNLEKLQEQ